MLFYRFMTACHIILQAMMPLEGHVSHKQSRNATLTPPIPLPRRAGHCARCGGDDMPISGARPRCWLALERYAHKMAAAKNAAAAAKDTITAA